MTHYEEQLLGQFLLLRLVLKDAISEYHNLLCIALDKCEELLIFTTTIYSERNSINLIQRSILQYYQINTNTIINLI